MGTSQREDVIRGVAYLPWPQHRIKTATNDSTGRFSRIRGSGAASESSAESGVDKSLISSNITTMKKASNPQSKKSTTTKMWESSLVTARKIAAHTGETLHEVWDRLVSADADAKKINRK